MYKDLKSFKNYASLYSKRPFISFREIIYENCLNCFIVLYLDFLHLCFLFVSLTDFLNRFMNYVSKEITFVVIVCDANCNVVFGMPGNSIV